MTILYSTTASIRKAYTELDSPYTNAHAEVVAVVEATSDSIAVSPNGVAVPMLIKKYENTGTYIYTGFADTGTAVGTAAWLIMRETIADGTILWKQGAFSNTWTARASGTYE